MTTATPAPQAPAKAEATNRRSLRARDADQCVTFQEIGWDGYLRMLRLRGERSRPRMIYLDRDLLLMSPGRLHEADRDRFGHFVVEVAFSLGMPFHMAGSMTYRRRKKEAGVEPDRSYYFANAHRVQGKKDINLRIDPPPDLSIEIVYSHAAEAAVEVSRRLGIREVWVATEKGLKFLVLGPKGRYAESETSPTFPLVAASEILAWIHRPEGEGATDFDWLRDLRLWIQETLVPRAANREP